MALERRDGNLYYYRSIRDGEKVRKVYVGAGEIARISHEGDILRRTGREAQWEKQRAELERLDALAAPVEELSEAAEILARAHLIASGCHTQRRVQTCQERLNATDFPQRPDRASRNCANSPH